MNRTALHFAVAANHRQVVQYLLDQGAKLDAFDKDQRSPVTIVCVNIEIALNNTKIILFTIIILI